MAALIWELSYSRNRERRFANRPYVLKNGLHCASRGGAVRRLTTIKHASDAANAGKIIGARDSIPAIFQSTASNVPAQIELRPPAVVVRFQKNAATTAGVIPAP